MAATVTKTSKARSAERETSRASKSGIVTIPGIKNEIVTTLIVGTAPLIMHKFSAKSQQMILAKHMGEAIMGREAKDPVANYNAARHRLTDGSDGFPAGGMKGAIASASGKEVGFAKTVAKGVLRVAPDDPATNLIRIITPFDPIMREDTVRNGGPGGVVDIRHRPAYWPWAMVVRLEFMPQYTSVAKVLQAVAVAGFKSGIGEWRPSSPKSLTGTFGTWRLATPEEVDAYDDGALFADVDEAGRRIEAGAFAVPIE